MALAQMAGQVVAAIQRARGLFSSSPTPVTTGAGSLVMAGQSTRQTDALSAGLLGVAVDQHAEFVGVSAGELAAAARTDSRLQGYLGTAAHSTQSGAGRLDQLLAQARAIARVAGSVPPGDGQQAVLSVLRSLLAQSDQVVAATQQQAAVLASQVRALDYSGGRDTVRPAGFGDGGDGEPSTDGPGSPPVLEGQNTGQQDDLDSSSPGTGITLGGDGHPGQPRIHIPGQYDGLNPLPVPPDAQGRPQRAIPAGMAVGPHGEHYAFYAIVPYFNPDGTRNTNFTSPQTVVVDLAHPDKVLYTLPISQVSGAFDPVSGRMVIIGNDPQTNSRGLWESAPIGQNSSWGTTLASKGAFQPNMNGDRENQIVALPNGKGFMVVGAANGRPIEGVVASTPEGLLTAPTRELAGNLPDGQVPYGPTVTDIKEVDGKEVVTMRVSTFGQLPREDPYDPRTYTTTFSVTP